MKKQLFGLFALAIGLVLVSCGGPSEEDVEKELDEMLEQLSEDLDNAEDDVEVETLDISAEMADFIAPFDGTAEAVMASLEKYGANEEVVDHDMGMYNLKNPEVTGQEGNCYSLTCISGAVENYYEVCWEDGKITSIVENL